jgi:hypothetical protein
VSDNTPLNDIDRANAWARQQHGSEVDAAAASMGLSVVKPDAPPDEQQRLWVELPGRDNRDIADFAGDMLKALVSHPIFRREGVVVTIDPNTGLLDPMDATRFLTWISKRAVVFEDVLVGPPKNKQSIRIRRTMPEIVARGTLRSDEFRYGLRPLTRVNMVRMPVFRRDGRMQLLEEGYDEESGIFTLPSTAKIDEKMTLEAGRAVLEDYYAEFQWADLDPATKLSRSKAVAICADMALYGMGLQEVEASRMGFIFRSSAPGGGKSLLAQMAITSSYGLPETTTRASDEELRKGLDSAALQGSPYIFMDNLKGHLESALLEAFVTSPVWGGRVMGTQIKFKARKGTILIVTGNNLSLSPDLQRRMLQCDVHVESFDLQEKQPRRDLNPVVLNRPEVRSEFLSALWALMRHWDQAGRAKAGEAGKPYRVATFADWSDIFGGIVQAAGYGNPLVKPPEEQQADQKTPHQRKLVELMSCLLFPETGREPKPYVDFTFQEIVDCCYQAELFDFLMGEGKVLEKEGGEFLHFNLKPSAASRMGRMLTDEMSGKTGRIFTVYGERVRFRKHGEGRNKAYRVELVKTAA